MQCLQIVSPLTFITTPSSYQVGQSDKTSTHTPVHFRLRLLLGRKVQDERGMDSEAGSVY